MTDSYHYSLRQAYQLLMGLGRQIKQEYPVDHYFLNPDDRNSGVLSLPIPMHVVTPTVKHLRFQCIIGIQALVQNQNLTGMVRDQDLVFCVKHVMHERRHLQQYLEFYQHPTLDYHIEMGKAHIISECCHGYCNHLYWYLPSKLDAEVQSFLDTAEYFGQLASLGVVIDAKTLLYKQYTELPQSSVWHGLPQVNTFDDMIQSLRNQKYAYRNMDRGFPFDINFEQDRERLHRLRKYDVWDFVLSASPEDRSTTDYDDKLLAMLLDLNPKLLSKHAGLQEEGKRVTSLYPGELPTGMAALFKDVVHLLSKDEDGLRL